MRCLLPVFGFVWLLITHSKKTVGFDPLANRQTIEKRALYVSLLSYLMIIIVSTIGFGGFKPLVEFNGSLNRSILALFSRIVYYFAETALIVLTIIFGQEFCERQFSIRTNIPGGRFFLALTWGLMHFLLQGVAGSFYTIFFSIVSGIIFIFFRKNSFISYLVISVAFIL
ncbi:hypothetical protein [Enterococcus sp. AZ163]|uniref:hypothetical protein n=1 Tax=Enterococcus sp. AZ163 TaxID=2774638 RepID=UPI003D2795B9